MKNKQKDEQVPWLEILIVLGFLIASLAYQSAMLDKIGQTFFGQ